MTDQAVPDPAVPAPATANWSSGLHSRFEAAAAAQPESIALIDGERHVTYRELDRRSAVVAAHLQQRSSDAENLVGVCLQRGADLVVALLGILRSGAAYVPLDPAYPRDRIDFILGDADVDVVITDVASAELVAGAKTVLISELPYGGHDDIPGDVAEEATDGGQSERPYGVAFRTPVTQPDRLAYLIYTSGSTGRPKAVAITHGNATAMLSWATGWWDPEDLSGVLASTSVCFDLSVFEIFLPLSHGGTVILAEDALALPELPARDRVRLVNTVPSAMNQLVLAGLLPETVRTVNLAGEALPRQLADQIYALPHVQRLWNLYGPSEDTTYSTFGLVPRADDAEPSIGRPIDGTQAWVLDADLQLVGGGEVGELYLSGTGVARGYLHRPGLTADRFLPDPFSGVRGGRMYRTGDLARWHRGELMFLGRTDHQVKIRGHRIELGEVDAVLVRHPAVAAAVTISDVDAADEARLVSYVQLASDVDIAELRLWLSERLPSYAVPAVLMALDVLPTTPNGKVDRAALPAPVVEREQSRTRYVAPVSALEHQLAAIWVELLGVDRVGSADRFDALGGHSLLAMRMLGRIAAELSTLVPLGAFLAAPTVAALAGLVEAHRGSPAGIALHGGVGTSPGPLSPVEEDFWFSEQMVRASSMYTVPLRFRVRGRIDAARIGNALSAVVARHDALRTAYTELDGQVVATVIDPYPVDLTVVDVRGHAAGPAQDDAAERTRVQAAHAPIDVATGRLLQAVLIRATDDAAELMITVHHIGFDGYSTGVLTTELAAFLNGSLEALGAPEIQGRDYAAWRSGSTGAQQQGSVDYWRDQLDGADLLLELPADHPRPAVLSFRGRRTTRTLDPDLLDNLQQLGRRYDASLFVTLLAGLDVLVSQLTGRTDFVVGAQTADRMAPQLRDHIGLCINTLPVRARCDGDPAFIELLVRTRETVYAGLEHHDVSYVDIIRALNLPRSLQHTNLVQVMLAVQNYAVPAVHTPDLTMEHLAEADNGTAKVDLTLFVEFPADGPVLAAEWSTDLFTAGTIDSWLDHYLAILTDAVDRPGRAIAELGMSSAVRRLRSAAVGEAATWEQTDPLHVLVARTAAAHPTKVAVTDGTQHLTYAELVSQAHQLAARLRALDVGPESLVAICVERHPRMLVGLLGILAAGGAYLPLDPDFPADRIDYMLRDSGAALLITETHLLDGLPGNRPRTLLLDTEDLTAEPTTAPDVVGEAQGRDAGCRDARPRDPDILDRSEPLNSPDRLDQLAYVLYTSGSTGRPKGVEITHASMVNFLWAMQRSPGLSTDDRVAALTTLSFDIAGLELWLPLLVGAQMVILDRQTASDGALLAERLDAYEVSVLQATPMTWRLLLSAGWTGRPTMRAWCGGEALPVDLAVALGTRVAELWNLYGPTEATIWTSIQRVEGEIGRATIPIGRPIHNTSAWPLDEHLRPVPWGAVGELCLGGAGVARGYRGSAELTADRFVPDPYGPPGSRLYRTGDRARFRDDATLEFLGRNDDQVKVRGFRIELGEVETVLRALPGIAAAAAAVWGTDPADQRLVAYVVPIEDQAVDPDALRTAAAEFLPDHMVPSQIEVLASLPLTANRKLDRKALPAPNRGGNPSGRPLSGPFEEIVADVWCEVLGVEQVSAESNFFSLGGHSLLATRVVSRLGQRFELPIAVRLVFEAPTVAGQARRIEADLLSSLEDEA
ncbi:MAG: amino acid adenylation domain-containing protein [Geodermatophilaceae bacterium]|nr:amino acid adenylation domain-containing protein [Geodermatophilaceae bacterium]